MSLSLNLAITASVLIGLGEALGAQFVKSHRAEVVTATYLAAGVPVTLFLLTVVSSSWRLQDVLFGLVAGALGGVALMLLYLSYNHITVGVGTPIIGVQSAVWPVLFSVMFLSEDLKAMTIVGILVGTAALVLVSFDRTAGSEVMRGVGLAMIGGFLYGVTIVFLATTSEESGMWPVVAQRVSGAVVVGVYALKVAGSVFPKHSFVKVAAVGSFSAFGASAYVIAAQRGSISEVAVAGAQYPAVAVAASYLLFRIRIRWWQTVGLLASVVSVCLIALA